MGTARVSVVIMGVHQIFAVGRLTQHVQQVRHGKRDPPVHRLQNETHSRRQTVSEMVANTSGFSFRKASRNLAAIFRESTLTGTRNFPRAGFQC